MSIPRAFPTSFVLVLFVYSGMIKWIPFPIDPTILFGACLLAILGFEALTGMLRVRRKAELLILTTLAFFSWYLFTAVYTVSDAFWQHKALTLALSVLAFVAPIVCLTSERHFQYLDNALILLAVAAIAFVLGFYAMGSIEFLLLQGYDEERTKIPNYLQLGSVIGVGVLLCLARPTLANVTIAVSGFAALLVLGARGPIAFTVLMAAVGYFAYSSAGLLPRFSFAKYGLAIAAGVVAFFSWAGAGRTVQRFSAMLTDEGALAHGFRVSEFSIAGEVISSSPILGVGLGGYGSVAYGIDADAYPHNLFLEAFAEAGILGLGLLVASILIASVIAFDGRTTRRGATYAVLVAFYLLNYSKSGGFIGTRDLYMVLGVLMAYVNLRSLRRPAEGT